MGFSLKAMWQYKCPRCRKGNMFKKPFQLSSPLAMNDRCEVCNLKMEPEPGFYFGAMFLSYVIASFMFLVPTLLLVFVLKWSSTAALTFTFIFAAITYIRFLRGSRALWLHINVKYNPSFIKK